MRWITNDRAKPFMDWFMQSGWPNRNVQMARMMAVGEPRFINRHFPYNLHLVANLAAPVTRK
ncbi:hypothetical protein [Shinella zoogloeoides]|uniref:Uncharacterized protein n=1 Tax=Shinella zoogloeoides TaxID=352475 RepID=A0A6N8TNJ1_SHIZO|nr:hypothetical protein [Shinella zoogloeoides]MXO02714.1 hypothetical protein [Shinella zoogloeoides]UEX81834.1 hypothetical protein K8M09_00540 [Shinella zoogloeoides]